jgi:type IV pilus assembly protein PilY1
MSTKTMRTSVRKILHLIGIALLVGFPSTEADDTDIYLNPSVPTGSEPLVMFSIDYRSNLGSTVCSNLNSCPEADFYLARPETAPFVPVSGKFTFFDHLRLALRLVFADLDGISVGLMLNHDNSNNCAGPQPNNNKCSNGGYIALGFDTFDAADTNGHKAAFHDILNAMPTPGGNVSHSMQGAELFFEFFRYLTGQGIYNGRNGYTDYGTNQAQNLSNDGAAYDWDSTIESGANYVSPLGSAGACAKIFTINMMFQVSNQESDSNAAIEDTQANGGMAGIGNVPNNGPFETVIDYLNDVDLADGNFGTVSDIDGTQNVTSYFVVDPRFINNTTTQYAINGGTVRPLELGDDPQALIDTLTEIFNQILSVSTTFVAASVPVNVFNRAEIVDNVYIAIFQADGTGYPLWPGNIKKLKFSQTTLADGSSDLTLVDANGNDAIAADGRIRFSALTFWTDSAALPTADPNSEEVDGADGRVVNRGAGGQQIPGFLSDIPSFTNADGGRQIYYNSGGSLVDFDADNATGAALKAVLGAGSNAEAAEIIAFTRGIDIDNWDGDSSNIDARPWMMGDALHSRPVPINYGARGGYSTSNPAIFIAMGTNDGHLRFIRNTTTGGAESGEEVWSFVPFEVMGVLNTLRTNTTVSPPHPYGVDGPSTVWMDDANGNGTVDPGEDVWLFFGLRRGGSAYYGLDISDPENPALLWTITPSSSGFGDLGATFSQPRVAMMESPLGTRPLIVVGGGYDFDKDSGNGTDDSVGNAIYVIDAETGALVWNAEDGNGGGAAIDRHPDMDDSIPSDVALFDSDGDGFSDRAYVGDTGGRVWRVDLKGSDNAQWTASLIADVGRHTSTGSAGEIDRRFFHRPDVVQSRDSIGAFDAVVIGAGNRPDPLDKDFEAENWVYMIKDRNTVAGTGADTGYEHVDFGDVTDNCLQNASCGGSAPDITNGWALELTADGEKSLASPLTIGGIVFFTSFLPPGSVGSSSCAPAEGNGNLYAVNLQDATAVFNYNAADDDPGQGDDPNSAADRSTLLASEGIPAEVVPLPSEGSVLTPQLSVVEVPGNTRWRTYWYQLEDDG